MSYITNTLPPEMRREIFSYCTLKSCLALPRVCRLFREEVESEFLREKCLAHFPELSSIPKFIEPLVASVENPWKWICLSLSCQKANKALYPVAEALAQTSLKSFSGYLQSHIAGLQSEQQKLMDILDLAEGFDIDVEIEQAEEEANENWTEDEEQELNDLKDRIINLGLDDTFGKIAEEAQKEISPFINPFSPREMYEEILKDDGPFLLAIQKRSSDPLLPRMVKLLRKRQLALWRLEKLEQLRMVIARETMYLRISLTRLERCATAVFYHTLYFLPHLKNWMPHFEDAKALEKLLNSSRGILMTGSTTPESLLQKLPAPFPQIIAREFSRQTVSRNMDSNLGKLRTLFETFCDSFFIIRRKLQRDGSLDVNPLHDLKLMSALLQNPSDKRGTLFRYPEQNPDLEEVSEKLERGLGTMESLLLSQEDAFDISEFNHGDEVSSSDDED